MKGAAELFPTYRNMLLLASYTVQALDRLRKDANEVPLSYETSQEEKIGCMA